MTVRYLFAGGLVLLASGAASAAQPSAARFAQAAGCPKCQVTVVRALNLPESRVEAYSAKLWDARSRTPHHLTLLADGTRAAEASLRAAEEAAYRARYGALKPRLYALLQSGQAPERVPVHVWTKVYIEYPRKEELLAARSRMAAFQADVASRLSKATAPIVGWLQSRGYEAQVDAKAPMIRAELSAGDIKELGRLGSVAWVDLDEPGHPTSTVWYTITNVGEARSITTGANVRACFVEGDQAANTTFLRIAATASPTGYTDSHIQQTMGMASNSFTGNATSITDASLFQANWDQFPASPSVPTMWQWCDDQSALVDNFSWSMAFPNDPNFTSLDGQIDFYVKNFPFPLIVAAAGNGAQFVENKGFNELSVGASDDKTTTDRADDTIASFSAWQNPTLAHSDYEIPHLVAPGACVDSADQACLFGTSFAAPQATGAAMLVIGRDSTIGGWPEEIKAILMTTATRNVDGASLRKLPASTDGKDGVGLLDTRKAVLLANPGNRVELGNTARSRGHWHGTIFPSSFDSSNFFGTWNLSADSSGRMRVAVSWDGTGTCNADFTVCSDTLDADLDLWVLDANGNTVCSSRSFDSSYEFCDFSVTSGARYTVKLSQHGFTASSTFSGLSWYRY
jgi:hypothetical protein